MSLVTRSRAAAAAVAAATVLSLAVAPAASAAPFMVKGNNPSLADWTAQMKYLLNPKTPDSALAINLESGKDGVPAAKFFRAMGNRNANWKWEFQGPTKTTGNISTAMFHLATPPSPSPLSGRRSTAIGVSPTKRCAITSVPTTLVRTPRSASNIRT